MNPEYQPAWNGLGSAYRLMGNLEAALEAHLTAVRLSIRAPAHLAALGETYADMGRRRDALDILAELERRWPAKHAGPRRRELNPNYRGDTLRDRGRQPRPPR